MGIVVAVAAVLALGVCGCIGVGGVLLDRYAPQPVAEDPYYDDPYYDGDPDDLPYPTAPAPEPTPARKPATVPSDGSGRLKVVYEVTGRGRAYLQYYDANGDFIQTDRVALPWRMSLRAPNTERVMVIASHSDGSEEGRLDCTITVNGKTAAEDGSLYGAECFA